MTSHDYTTYNDNPIIPRNIYVNNNKMDFVQGQTDYYLDQSKSRGEFVTPPLKEFDETEKFRSI